VSEFFKPPAGKEGKIQDAKIAKFQVEDYIPDMIESTLVRDPSQEMATQQWASIFTKKVPPLCDVHGLACIELVTKKPGPNVGRGFWICSKPVGPGYDNGKSKAQLDSLIVTGQKWEINPEYRCNFFK
jgi:AP endonuclease-2